MCTRKLTTRTFLGEANAMTLAEFLLVLLEFVLLNVQCLWIALREAVHWPAPPPPKSVAGKVVLITGSGHGVGRELALRFARLGARVVLVDIHKVRRAFGPTDLVLAVEKRTVVRRQDACVNAFRASDAHVSLERCYRGGCALSLCSLRSSVSANQSSGVAGPAPSRNAVMTFSRCDTAAHFRAS